MRSRKLSKTVRPQDVVGFEGEEDLQEAIELDDGDRQSGNEDNSDEEVFIPSLVFLIIAQLQFGSKSDVDIESFPVPNHLVKKVEPLDKMRGFVKYQRQKQIYRPVEERMKDWDEVYDFEAIRKNIREQAAR